MDDPAGHATVLPCVHVREWVCREWVCRGQRSLTVCPGHSPLSRPRPLWRDCVEQSSLVSNHTAPHRCSLSSARLPPGTYARSASTCSRAPMRRPPLSALRAETSAGAGMGWHAHSATPEAVCGCMCRWVGPAWRCCPGVSVGFAPIQSRTTTPALATHRYVVAGERTLEDDFPMQNRVTIAIMLCVGIWATGVLFCLIRHRSGLVKQCVGHESGTVPFRHVIRSTLSHEAPTRT